MRRAYVRVPVRTGRRPAGHQYRLRLVPDALPAAAQAESGADAAEGVSAEGDGDGLGGESEPLAARICVLSKA
jgi:hypothetical protein